MLACDGCSMGRMGVWMGMIMTVVLTRAMDMVARMLMGMFVHVIMLVLVGMAMVVGVIMAVAMGMFMMFRTDAHRILPGQTASAISTH